MKITLFPTMFVIFATVALLLISNRSSSLVEASYFSGFSSRLCPTPEFIQPCTCKKTAFGVHVVCLEVTSSTDLSRIFNVLRDYEIGMLLLQGTQLTAGNAANCFNGLRLSVLRLVGCTVPDSVFQTLRNAASSGGASYFLEGLGTTLTRVDIINCNLGSQGLTTMGLAKLGHLQEINIHGEALNVVKKNWFAVGTGAGGKKTRATIKVLRLDENGVTSLEDNVFGNLRSIAILSLAKNSINTLKRNILPSPANSLQTLDLSTNALTTLPDDFFTNMPALTKVLLYHNNLRSISQAAWTPVWDQLETLWINANPINCDAGMMWIVETARYPTAFEGVCAEPARMEGVHLSGLRRDPFFSGANPAQAETPQIDYKK